MAIVTRPKRLLNDIAKADPMEFIHGAEQQTAEQIAENSQPPKPRRKEPVIIRFDDDVLSRLDQAATKRGLSRAALVRLLVMEHLPD